MDSRLFLRLSVMSSKRVAASGYCALRRRQALHVPGLVNKIATAALRLTPRSLVRKLVRRLQD